MSELPVMVITGSSRGIGRGMAEHFAANGYRVAGCSRSPSTIENERYSHMQLDVGDEQQVRRWISCVKETCGRIDVLVCNAGIPPSATALTLTAGEHFDQIVRTNLAGTFYVCREVAKQMMRQRAGRIVTISSITADLHEEGTAVYSASKSAVTEMTKVMAKELAPLGVTCNVIAPSLIATPAVQGLGEEIAARFLSKQTFRRVITVDEICNVVAFFASPASGCITGQVIHMGLVN